MEAYSSVGRSSGFTEEALNLSMTTKQPPPYDGKVSWFRYEELASRHPREDDSSRADSSETLTCARQSSRMTFCKNTLKKFFQGSTNVYLYRLHSFFNHRRQNTKFLIFTSKIEILLMRLNAAWMDLMLVHTARSPEFIASVQDANARRMAAPVSEPRLQICCPQTIQKYSGSASTACRQDTRKRFLSATIFHHPK